MITFHQSLPALLVGFGLGMASLAYTENITNEPKGELTLPEALTLADMHHPELQASRLDVQAAESRVSQAALLLNPGFSLEVENFGGKNETKGFDAAEYTTTFEQTLELGGKRSKRVKVAKAERQLTLFDLEAKRLDIRAETTRRFVALQSAQERLALSQESLALAEEFAQAVAARVHAGKVSPLDTDKAQILLAQQKVALESAQRELQAVRVQLSIMWGSAKPTFLRVKDDLHTIPEVPDLTVLLTRLPANPDLARWTAEVEQRQAVLAQEKAARLPDVTVAGGVRRYSETDNAAFVASLSLPLPLWDRHQEKVREATLLVEKAEQQQRAAKMGAVAVLTETFQTLSTTLNRITTYKQDVIPRAKTVLEAVQIGYTQGKFAYLEVLEARRTFFDSRVDYVEALVLAHKAIAEVERVVGGSLFFTEKN